jgi:protoporphyrinogen oxidase
MIKGAPPEVLEAAAKLACSEVVLVNIGVDHVIDVADHWTYFYDADIPFSRLSHPSKFSPHVAPEGTSSLQAEVYFSSKWRPRTQTPEELIEPVIQGLEQCGLIKDRARIIHNEHFPVRIRLCSHRLQGFADELPHLERRDDHAD